MMKRLIIFVFLLFSAVSFAQNYKLWYNFPAREWEEALPLGNGRLGAMVYGGIDRECISLNEETIWGMDAKQHIADLNNRYLLEEKRKLIFQGKYLEAQKLELKDIKIPDDKKLAKQAIKGMTSGADTYEPLADLFLHFGSTESIPTDYRRELNLDSAVSTVTYKVDGVTYKREVFSSYPDQAIVIKLSADQLGKITFSSKVTRRTDVKDDMYRYDPGVEPRFIKDLGTLPTTFKNIEKGYFSFGGGSFPEGVKFISLYKVNAKGGNVSSTPDGFKVEKADEAVMYITSATDFYGFNPADVAKKQMDAVSKMSYSDLLNRHLADYQALYRRVDFELDKGFMAKQPTDKRVLGFQIGMKDPRAKKNVGRDNDLYAMYFQYVRYLMIANSRKGSMPPALQGLWNNSLMPPWRGHHTTDINVQMNFWPAEAANLSDCHVELLDYLTKNMPTAIEATKVTYGTRGMVWHGMKQWGPSTSYAQWFEDFAGWVAQDFWNHYDYTQDKEFLRTQAYPFMKEAALFYLDHLVEYPGRGYLVSGPEMSPENAFINPQDNTTLVKESMGTTISRAIIHELFENCIKASEILGVDIELRKEMKTSMDKLSPYQIGKYGQLQEWLEDFDENDLGHRHVSHLYPVYPGTEITKTKNPILFEAAKKSMQRRLDNGGGWTGWGKAWMICLAARFQDANLSEALLESIIAKNTYYNLFDSHPRNAGNSSCFQIDGNFGTLAGMTEMLLQTHDGCIDILPAKPEKWKDGHINGLRGRGNVEVDIAWAGSKLKSFKIHSFDGGEKVIKYGDLKINYNFSKGESVTFDGKLAKN
jgi:alpha-L-fucosidase 2